MIGYAYIKTYIYIEKLKFKSSLANISQPNKVHPQNYNHPIYNAHTCKPRKFQEAIFTKRKPTGQLSQKHFLWLL